MTEYQQSRRHFVDGLVAVSRFYRENPDAYYDGMRTTLSMYVDGRSARQTLAVTAKAFGECHKFFDERYIVISKQFSEKIKVDIFAPRGDVCQRVVLGTRPEPAIIIPATREICIPEATVEVLGWKCDPVLAL